MLMIIIVMFKTLHPDFISPLLEVPGAAVPRCVVCSLLELPLVLQQLRLQSLHLCFPGVMSECVTTKPSLKSFLIQVEF